MENSDGKSQSSRVKKNILNQRENKARIVEKISKNINYGNGVMKCSGESTGSSSNITQYKKLRMIKSIYSKAKRALGNVIGSISMCLDRKIFKSFLRN